MSEKNPLGLATAAVIGVAAIVSCWILGNAFVRGRSDNDMIRVTGSARKEIKSDFIIWSGRIGFRGNTINDAYSALNTAMAKTQKYLEGKGIPKEQIVTNAVTTQTLFARNPGEQGYDPGNTFRQVAGYELAQVIEVRSDKVELVGQVSRDITELISQGVPIESNAPQYIYTKISDVKVEILAAAAEDARRRAEEIAKSSRSSIGGVRFARMSPLQITPIYSYEVSGEGQNDTSSLDKAITAIVTMGFSVR